MAGDEELTHEEIWDDSALQNSWDEALQEYKKYHSLAARGEKVTPIIGPAAPPQAKPVNISQEQTLETTGNSAPPSDHAVNAAANSSMSGQASNVPQAPVPQVLAGSVNDENLKNLMMSWYYAGYYTGVYEGRQQAFASMQEGG